MYSVAGANAFIEDYYRHTNPRCTPTLTDARIFSHTSGQSAPVNTFWELRSSAKNQMVAQAIVHLLPRSARNEGLCLLHIPNMPVDNTSR